MCAGDCPKKNCQSKFKRTCGGAKDDRGCGTGHAGHELFCKTAKLCFNVAVEVVMELEVDGDEESKEGGTLLPLMKIPSFDGGNDFESVLWDPCSTGCFVRIDHADKMKFPFVRKRLRVMTLGGKTTETVSYTHLTLPTKRIV